MDDCSVTVAVVVKTVVVVKTGGACFGVGIHLDAVVYCRGWGRYTGGVRAWMGWT